MSEEKPESLKKTITVDPLKGMGVIFPAGTSKEEKDIFAMQLEMARKIGKPIEIDSSIKIVPLNEEPVVPILEPVVSKPEPQPDYKRMYEDLVQRIPVPQPIPVQSPTTNPTTTTSSSSEKPTNPNTPNIETKTETIVTHNPISGKPDVTTETVQQ